ncbi:MAG: hypothetical protein RBT34_04445 [Anaerolineaceae bacterium]|jgi:hypothetical protein|nr:hypothetical protein [Anaerolineaceae bacterium]
MTIEMQVIGTLKRKPLFQAKYVRMEIASTNRWRGPNGIMRESEEIIPVFVYGKLADNCKGLEAGDIIQALGKPRSNIKTANGTPQPVQELKAVQVNLLAKTSRAANADDDLETLLNTTEAPTPLPCYQYSGVKAS